MLRKKIYINPGKLHILKCLDFPEEDMRWFTLNEQESQIHVVPMWTLASFKRLKHMSNQYAVRGYPFYLYVMTLVCRYTQTFFFFLIMSYVLDVYCKF